MLRVVVAAVYVLVGIRYGNWRKWKEFYSTYLFVIAGDLAYNFIFYDRPLWIYERLVSHTFSDFFIAVIVFPCAITLFLTYYPPKMWRQALYILAWTGLNTLIESISHALGFISYHNSWNLAWSTILYYIAFVMVRIHYVKPLWAWPISLLFTHITMVFFGVPLGGTR